ncbi:MAG TPA: PfkB family carbohydrate kinase, partial [Gemmataceae bacterium]|nr:PfkB family carbohydrate kinase [Gemmataceae bacterium]
MSANLPQLIDAFAGRSVLVIGEAMLDSYLEGHTGRFCPEAPVPIVALAGRTDLPGGAANAAVNAQALGGRVAFLSVTGDDDHGEALRHALRQRGVSTEHLLVQPGRRTLTKQRVLASGQMLLRLDQGSTEPLDEAAEQALLERLVALFPQSDAVILSDYRYGVLTPRIIRALADLQARWSKVVVADSRRLPVFREVGLTACKPNYDEAVALLGAGALDGFHVRAEGIARYGEQLLERTGAQVVAVTLDCEGALVFEGGRAPHRTYAQP